ncbi:MAG: HXXEE domain-containing protein [Bacteroidota bacterium]
MTNSRALGLSIMLLFAMLWLPLGQYDFLLEHWMKIGTYGVPFLLLGAFSLRHQGDEGGVFQDFRFIGILMLIAYILHQFEEHWVDVLGNTYAFYTFNNNFILGNLGEPDSEVKPLTEAAIFVINTALVWLVGALAIYRSPRHLFPLISMASIIFVNALVHILAAIAQFQYNPGLLTSVVIFVPIYLWFVKYLTTRFTKSKKQLIGGIIWAVLAHVIMVGGLLMANWFHIIPEFVYFIALGVWSLLPLAIFAKSPLQEVV